VQKTIRVQIGSYRLRDKVTRSLLPCVPIYAEVTTKVAVSLAERVASLLVDCYQMSKANEPRVCKHTCDRTVVARDEACPSPPRAPQGVASEAVVILDIGNT